MPFRRYRHQRSSYLISGIPIKRHPVAAYENGVDPSIFHNHGGHIVANQRYIHAGSL